MMEHVPHCLWGSKFIGRHKKTFIFEFSEQFSQIAPRLLSGKHAPDVIYSAKWCMTAGYPHSNGSDFSLIFFNDGHGRVCEADQRKVQFMHVCGCTVVHKLVS